MDKQVNNDKNDELFEALLKSAAFDAIEKDLDELPSCEEANRTHKPSKELDAKIALMLQESLTKSQRRRKRSNFLRLVAGLMIVFVMSVGVMFCFEPTRHFVLNICADIKSAYYNNNRSKQDISKNHIEDYYLPTYISEGFEETGCSADLTSKNSYIYITYTDQEEHVIQYSQTRPQESITMDTRYETYYEVDINGVDAHLFITTHEHHTHDLIWQTGEAYFSFSCSYEVDPEELIRMAENLQK